MIDDGEAIHYSAVERGTPMASRTLREVGVAPFDIVKVETEHSGLYVRLEGDRALEMKWS